jgi:hypothetical protein
MLLALLTLAGSRLAGVGANEGPARAEPLVRLDRTGDVREGHGQCLGAAAEGESRSSSRLIGSSALPRTACPIVTSRGAAGWQHASVRASTVSSGCSMTIGAQHEHASPRHDWTASRAATTPITDTVLDPLYRWRDVSEDLGRTQFPVRFVNC